MKKYDYLVVGSGLYGAVFAHEARKAGKSVLVIDKRPNIAGNVYTEEIEKIHVHKYGAHIFHTNNKKVWNYITQFAEFNRFTNSPVANYKGELYSLPFNMYTFNKMWGVVTPEEAKAYVKYQLGALKAFTDSHGVKIQHVKPHGALYNMAAVDEKLAKAMCEAVYEVDKDIIFMGLAGSKMIEAAEAAGLKAASEVFADRAYNDDGTLVSRKLEGSVIKDKDLAIKRVVRMVKEGKGESINGNDINIKADSICVHGDNPKALEFVKNIRETLIAEGVSIKNLF